MNALSRELLDALAEVFEEAGTDDGIVAAVLSGFARQFKPGRGLMIIRRRPQKSVNLRRASAPCRVSGLPGSACGPV